MIGYVLCECQIADFGAFPDGRADAFETKMRACPGILARPRLGAGIAEDGGQSASFTQTEAGPNDPQFAPFRADDTVAVM